MKNLTFMKRSTKDLHLLSVVTVDADHIPEIFNLK